MNYKFLPLIPVILLALSLLYLFWLNSTTGLKLDIDLKGGTQIIAESSTDVSVKELENVLKSYEPSIRTSRGLDTYTVFIAFDASIDSDKVLNTLKENGYTFKEYSIQTVGSAIGKAFFEQATIALAFAFLFMIITTFLIFKKFILAIRVIISAFADIIECLVLSQIVGITLSLATFAALLLLIGYSVDDDVMLTTRVTKGTGDLNERIKRARKTAFTMVGATIVALMSLYIITESVVIDQIASIMLFGLVFDLINTWMFNAPILRWYVEKGWFAQSGFK